MCVDGCEVISDTAALTVLFIWLFSFTSNNFDPCVMLNESNQAFLHICLEVSSEYIIEKRRMKSCYILFAKSNCLDGNRFGFSSKLTRLLLKTTKRLFQLFLQYFKTVESKGRRGLNSFKKQITVFSDTGDFFFFKVLVLLIIATPFRTDIYSFETLKLSFQKLSKLKNSDLFCKNLRN